MKTITLRAAALAALAAVAACDDSGTAPAADENLDMDVALLAADAAREDLAVMNTVFPLGAAESPVTYTVPVAYSVLDYTRSRTVTFFDVDGVEQPSYDALVTASIHTVLEVTGQVTGDGFDWSMNRTRDMWVTGLEGEETERTWNGSGTEDRSRARILEGDAVRTYDLTGTVAVEDVVRGVPRAEHPWPLSGTITRTLVIEVVNGPDGDRTVNRTVVITFNGTRYPDLTVNGESFVLDLGETGANQVRRKFGGNG